MMPDCSFPVSPFVFCLLEIPLLRLLESMVAGGLFVAQEAAADRPFLQRLLENPLLLPVGLLVVFYVTFLLPERRRKAEEAKLLASIQKNDRVITVGGMHATVVSASPDSDVVTLKIDESGNTRVKFNRSAIATVLPAVSDKTSSPPADLKK